MPRTKRVKSYVATNAKPDRICNADIRNFVQELDQITEKHYEHIENECLNAKTKFTVFLQEQKMHKRAYLKKPIEELISTGFLSLSTINDDLSVLSNTGLVHGITNNSEVQQRSRGLRTKSKDDEGYLTAGSRTSSLTRGSRVKKTTAVKKNPRRSRSCTNEIKIESSIKYTTPVNKKTENFGYITPKVKLNTPQALLRRPIIGEMAFSVQGSPLMTSDTQPSSANINVPLKNGQIVSIQPFGLLNDSQVPDLDQSVMEQVKTLQRNLSKFIKKNQRK